MATLAGLGGTPLVPDTIGLLTRGQQFGRNVASTALTPGLIEDIRGGDVAARDRLAELNPGALQNVFAAESIQASNQAAAIQQKVTDERSSAISRAGQTKLILKGGVEGLANGVRNWVLKHKDDADFDMQEAVDLANLSITDPQKALIMLEDNLAAANSEISIADQILTTVAGATAAQQDRQSLLRDLQSDDPQVVDSASIKLGLSGRATGAAPQVVTIGGVPHIFDKQSKTMVPVVVSGQEVTAEDVAATEATIAQTVAAAKATGTAGVELETAPQIAAATDAAKAGIKRSEKAFDSIGKIRTNIANLDEAVRLIDAGAETGAISSLFPSFTAATVALENLQGQLGLDVIGNTTFGALSESELKFALNTALPGKLDGPDLKVWLRTKRDAQEKLSTYLTSVATFMGSGGTVADFLQLQQVRQIQEEGASAAPVISEGTRIINSTTGQRMVFTNGAWQPAS